MFEDLTKAMQDERTKGWKNPVTHCTAGAVVFRNENNGSLHDCEILVARRIAGTPEAFGFYQTHFGTYVNPTDEDAEAAIFRGLLEKIGLTAFSEKIWFMGIVGPALWKSTIRLSRNALILKITDEQAEKLSPFLMNVFGVDATGQELGSHNKTIEDVQWMKFDELIAKHGHETNWIYWSIFYLWAKTYAEDTYLSTDMCASWRPGTYTLELAE